MATKRNDGGPYIYRTFITRNGRKLFARDYGHKAWRIPIRNLKKR